jgi:hypothetical protein
MILFAAVFTALPFVLLRGRALRRYFACDGALWAAFIALAAVTQSFRIDADPWLAFIGFGVIKLAAVSLFVAASDARDVRWSANRAAFAALLVYLLLIPAMTRHVVDGDEPYYLLMTESLVRDHDLDLRNQYAGLAHSETRRLDLKPQLGDPVGRHGEQHSHLEPLLAILMIPGYVMAGLYGAMATIALFAAMLIRSTVRLFEDEGIDDATTRALFPFIAFGPPIVFYATRIWAEVPGAWMLAEAVRGIRQHRAPRWMAAMLFLVLLKLRFLLIAVVLLAQVVASGWRRAGGRRIPRRLAIAAAAIIILPLIVFYSTTAHSVRELVPGDAVMWLQGLLGLVVDAQSGILFQAPFYLGGIFALTRWRATPPAFRLGMSASLLYIFTLVPRPEWHGGWSPPLRYIVVFMPILALGCAAVWESFRHAVAPVALWTMMLVAHGVAYPWRLFHIADGQSFIGEWLSQTWMSDFGRMLPSLVRPNLAAVAASVALVVAMLIAALKPGGRLHNRGYAAALPIALAMFIAAWFALGKRAGDRIEFEDAFVDKSSGDLFPPLYAVSRFVYRGGWIVRPGDVLTFRARGGASTIEYQAAQSAVIELGGRAYELPATGAAYGRVHVELPHSGITTLRGLSGAVNLDRMDHD